MTGLAALPLALALAAAAPAGATAGCGEPDGPDGGWCAAVASRPRLPLPSAEDRAALRAVYASPALARSRDDPAALRRLVAGLWARLLEALGSAEAERYASVGRAIFVAAGLVAALAALAAARRRREAPSRRRPPAGERAPLPPPDRSAALAQAELARGDHAGAVRHAFLSALAALEDSGRLPRDRTLTNGELAGRLAAEGPVAEEFGALGRTFDGAIYGRLPVARAEASEAVARALRLRAALGGRA